MRLRIDTSDTRFIVTRAAEPRLNFETGSPKVDTATGVPLYAAQLLALDDAGGEMLNVTRRRGPESDSHPTCFGVGAGGHPVGSR